MLISGDVDEYIKLTQGLPLSSDNPQLMRIRQVFEKKNKKHSQLADQLQVGQGRVIRTVKVPNPPPPQLLTPRGAL